jgi:hypothetical protein
MASDQMALGVVTEIFGSFPVIHNSPATIALSLKMFTAQYLKCF